jgi:regulator of replication initiation timing
MREREIQKQFNVLQQEVALTGEDLEALRRDQRALMDGLRLEVEALRRCLERLHPDSVECFAAVRAEVLHGVNPEAL